MRTTLVAVAVVGSGAWAQSVSVPAYGDESCGCGKSHALMLRGAAGLAIADGVPGSRGYGDREAFSATDLISNDLDIEIDPNTGFISGSNTMIVEARTSGVSQFTVMLRQNFAATATLNGSTAAAMSGPPTGSYARTITLDRAYDTGERFTVRVDYSGTAVSRGFGSIEFGTQNGLPVVASLSEAYYAATWFPAKDGDVFLPGDNGDKSTWKIAVTAPDTLRSVSNGLLLGVDTLSGGRKRYRWQTNYQMSTYLAAFCSTVYNTWTQTYTYPLTGGGTGSMPVEFNIYPASDTPGNRAAWAQSLTMMATYRPFYGEYPFVNEKYGIYEFPFGGGMEHQTNTGQGTFDEGVTAHELGHQWWGDNVTCKYWNDIWLNEGFATYTEALWFENKPGSSGTPALLAAMAARRPNAVNDSVYVYNASIGNMNRIFSGTFTYRKGGWVLHMLRHVLGDTVFFQGLRDYRAAFEGNGATTDDFRSVMSDTSGTDLTEYFQQWVYGAGAPAYSYAWQNATVNGHSYIKLRIDQTQDSTWGIAGAFKMPVDVRIDTASGSSTAKVQNTLRSQYFLVPAPAAATGIALDEFDWILNTGKTSVAYVAGAPKVAEALPAPGSTVSSPATVGAVTVYFSDNVTATSGAFTVTGPGGAVPFTYAYNAAALRATLTFGAPLAPGAYTVGVAQSVTANGGQALDGEVTANALPSGNGVAGGAAAWTFTVANPCPADWNNDGGVDGDDVIDFFAQWDAGNADFNGDSGTDGDDVIAFFGAWDGGC